MSTKRKLRFFNTTGPCNPDDHYMLPPADRLVGAQLHRYIEDKLYWVLHAPRQTGKTTFLKSWIREINSGDEAVACYVSVEDCQMVTNLQNGMNTIYKDICDYADWGGLPIPVIEDRETEGLLRTTLKRWAELVAPKPLIVLFDEVDVMEGEIKAIDKVLEAPARPFTAILGGSKVSSKITIIEQLLKKVDNLIIGGAMSFTFIKAQGGKIGNSLCEDDQLPLALDILAKAKELNVNIYLPEDTLITDAKFEDFSNPAAVLNTKICAVNAIPDGWTGVDAAQAALETWRKVIMNSKTILWNGPVGVFETPQFAGGTKSVAQMVADATVAGAYSLVGGGDSVAAVNQMGFADKVSYVSTGGGALLEYMEGIELPGVKAIRG